MCCFSVGKISMPLILRLSVGLLFSLFSFTASNAAGPSWPLPEGVKWIEVNGYPMAYQDNGQGIPIVLVHGSANDYRVWPTSIPVFATKLRVINVSLRHFYPERWDGSGTDFSITQHASDVA